MQVLRSNSTPISKLTHLGWPSYSQVTPFLRTLGGLDKNQAVRRAGPGALGEDRMRVGAKNKTGDDSEFHSTPRSPLPSTTYIHPSRLLQGPVCSVRPNTALKTP